jgi:alcohol dehydrogenase
LSGGVRFHKKDGSKILHYLGVSGFSQYTVAVQESLIKIDKNVPLAEAALFGCGIITGVGAVVNTAKVQPGEPVAIFGLGGVGLSALMGAKLVGASPIIVIDMLASKFEIAKKLGADYTLNPKDGDVLQAIRDLTGGGVEYAFEAVGNPKVLEQAFRATRKGGKTIAIGIPGPQAQLSIGALGLVAQEKTIMGSFMGSAVPRRDIPRLIGLYMAGKLPVDALLSQYISLEEVNAGFERLAQGSTIRQLIRF